VKIGKSWKIKEFCRVLFQQHPPNLETGQIKNVRELAEVSRRFHRDAAIPATSPDVDETAAIIETGHQPNFIPHSGTWKKAFLADFIAKSMVAEGRNAVAFYGFMDYNLSSAKLLYQNRVPHLNKKGFERIGLKRPASPDIWKRFNYLPKPDEREWDNVISMISRLYPGNRNVEVVIDELWKSYELSENLSDINAMFFARLCSRMGLNVSFFRCSDVQSKGLFLEVWKKVLEKLQMYNRVHNRVIEEAGLSNIGLTEPNSAPFWYHCECGGKVNMVRIENGSFAGECDLCGKKHGISEIGRHFDRVSPKAVMRDTVFFQGLGTWLFITGSGGSLEYGRISEAVARYFGFRFPATLCWLSREVYFGEAHKVAIRKVTSEFGINPEELRDASTVLSRIHEKVKMLASEMDDANHSGDSRAKKKCASRCNQTIQLVETTCNLFSVKPSLIDVIASEGAERVLETWKRALESSEVVFNGTYRIISDTIYDTAHDGRFPAEVFEVFQNLKSSNLWIDPLNVFGGGV